MPKLNFTLAVLSVTLQTACSTPGAKVADSGTRVVLPAEVEWGPLNPARGASGPQAGGLWGDRTGPGPSGFLVEFQEGFRSPPHIHNVSYRGVVIRGLLHNADPDAEDSWMPSGSFWTQPKGGVHVTSASGRRNLAYIEIEEGPYLVLPVEEEFRDAEAPINVDVSSIDWSEGGELRGAATGPQTARAWGNPESGPWTGTLLKLPPGYSGKIRSLDSTLQVVVIQGRPGYVIPGESRVRSLEPGSYFSSEGDSAHQVSCDEEECILYLRTDGEFDVVPGQHDE